MKTKILILEDNFAKFFSTKQVLESQLKLEVQAQDIRSSKELMEATFAFDPDVIICRPEGGVLELLTRMKKRRSNRRNTEITLLLTQDFDNEVIRQFESMVSRHVADAA